MASLPRILALHLLAATSVPLAVAAALAGLWILSGWLPSAAFEGALIRAVIPVLLAVTIAMYGLHFAQTVRTYRRGQGLAHAPVTPGPPPALDRVTRNHWESVGNALFVFLLFVGIGLLLGAPAQSEKLDPVTYYVFYWLGRGTLFVGAAMLVFSLALMTTHALRGIVRSFYWSLNGARATERRRNLPLEMAVAALPLFVARLVLELR